MTLVVLVVVWLEKWSKIRLNFLRETIGCEGEREECRSGRNQPRIIKCKNLMNTNALLFGCIVWRKSCVADLAASQDWSPKNGTIKTNENELVAASVSVRHTQHESRKFKYQIYSNGSAVLFFSYFPFHFLFR